VRRGAALEHGEEVVSGKAVLMGDAFEVLPPLRDPRPSQFPAAPAVGRKDDAGKLRFDLVDVAFEEGLADVLTYGANKYGANNWQKVEDPRERYYAALRRHVSDWRKASTAAERLDPESGRHHLLHAACCVMFLYWLDCRER
jgi:hypothetical protein